MLNAYVRKEMTSKITHLGQSSDAHGMAVTTVEQGKKTSVKWFYFLEGREDNCGAPVEDVLNDSLEASYRALKHTFG